MINDKLSGSYYAENENIYVLILHRVWKNGVLIDRKWYYFAYDVFKYIYIEHNLVYFG